MANLANGGRGIGNIVENHLVNPLSRYLFDNDVYEQAKVTIQEIDTSCMPPRILGTINRYS